DVHAYSKCLVFHSLDDQAIERDDETWTSLRDVSRSSPYSRDYVDLKDRIKDVYVVLTLYHLNRTYKIIEINSEDFYRVLELLKDSILKDGKYNIFFREYVKAELVVLINKWAKSLLENPVKKAHNRAVDFDAILHNLL